MQTAAAQRVDINVPVQSVQVVQSAIAASNTTYTSGLVAITGSNMVTVKSSGAGQTVIIDATQSVQVVQSAIAASNTTYTSGAVTFSGVGGGVTVQSNTGQRVDISVAAPVAQTAQTGISGIAASNTTYTSGSVTITGVGGGVTVSSNTGQRIDISVAAPVAQSVQTQNVVDVTLSGNTAGAMALVSSGTMTLAGGNNITLSQAGNAITISGAAAGGAQTAISSIAASNTTYTSGGVTITGSNMVTVRSTTGQGIVIDATQSVQVVQSAIAATNTTYTSGLVVFTGSNAATVKSSAAGQTVIIDVPTQTVQTQNMVAVSATNTLYSSGTVLFTGSNMITVKSSGAGQTIILDATQSVQTQNVVDVSLSGNTAGAMALISSGTLNLAGGNNITLSQNGQSVTISGAAAGGAQTAISGIAASNTTYTSGSVTFTGSNMVTVRSTTGQQVIIDATQSVQTQGQMSMGVSTGGNTQGNTGISGTRIVLVGTSNITLSQQTDANGATISISGPNAGAGGGVNIAASNTTYTSGTVVFSASDSFRSAISVASVGAQSVIISDAGPNFAFWNRDAVATAPAGSALQTNTEGLSVFPLVPHWGNRFPGNMTAEVIAFPISISLTATSISQQLTSTMNLYLYTRNSTSLSMINSATFTFGNPTANTSNTNRWNGLQQLRVVSSQWSSAPALLYGGEYYMGIKMLTNGTTFSSMSWINVQPMAPAAGMGGGIGSGNVNSAAYPRPGYAYLTSVGATPSSIGWATMKSSGAWRGAADANACDVALTIWGSTALT